MKRIKGGLGEGGGVRGCCMKRYGIEFDDRCSEVDVEVYCFLYDKREEGEDLSHGARRKGWDMYRRGGERMSKWVHFCNLVDMLWNGYGGEEVKVNARVEWNEWTDRMLRAMVYEDVIGLAGCASSGKSFAAAIYAIVIFLCAPNETLVLITSTSIKGAQLRVWKTVSKYWGVLDDDLKMGEMVYSKAMIRGRDASGKMDDSIGIQIVAAGSGSEKEAYEKLIGVKQERLCMIADELPQLPRAIVDAVFGNMVNGTNKEKGNLKFIAMGNPSLMTDAFGLVCEPKEGWDSVTEGDEEWETAEGMVLRFDAEKSPNLRDGTDYPWYPTKGVIQRAKDRWGSRSLMFYRQYRAFWYKEAATETIYSENEVVMYNGTKEWDAERDGEILTERRVAAADPAYTQGGDEFPFLVGRVITTTKGRTILEVLGGEALQEVEGDDRPRSHRMVSKLQELCSKWGVEPNCFGYDATGAGVAFRDVVVSEWSMLPKEVMFGGSASKRKAGITDNRPSCDVYANRVTELWVKGKGLLREGHLRGIPMRVLDQMCRRRYDTTTRRGQGKKVKIESKVEMKAREGYSPDWSDCYMVLLEVCIMNGLLIDVEYENVSGRNELDWSRMMRTHDVHSEMTLTYE